MARVEVTPGVIFKSVAVGGSEVLFAAALAVTSTATLATAGAALVASLAGTASAIYLARRRAGGTVRSSEAEVLWREGEALRTYLRDNVRELEAKVDALEKRIDLLGETNDSLRAQLERAVHAAQALEREVDRLQDLLDAHQIPYPPEV